MQKEGASPFPEPAVSPSFRLASELGDRRFSLIILTSPLPTVLEQHTAWVTTTPPASSGWPKEAEVGIWLLAPTSERA